MSTPVVTMVTVSTLKTAEVSVKPRVCPEEVFQCEAAAEGNIVLALALALAVS